jgi:hypothetical protein
MGDCSPRWISDYNFAKLFERVEALDACSGAWASTP